MNTSLIDFLTGFGFGYLAYMLFRQDDIFIKGYLKGVIDYSKGDLSFIQNLPEKTKKKYDIKINK